MGTSALRNGSILACAMLLAACGGSSDGGNAAGGAGDCADGFVADGSGNGCLDVSPANDCAAGTRAALGSTSCQPVAAITCPEGFVQDPSGWGCRDVSPDSACDTGTIEELGNSACAPIDDCNGAFPPVDATLFVDDDTAAPDATHFKTMSLALAAAHAGDVIAVEAGTYGDALDLKFPVTIVGRCASQVVMKSAGTQAAGIQALNVKGVKVSGLTLQGYRGGVVEQNGDVTVENVEIDGSPQSGLVVIGGAMHVSHTRVSGSIESGTFGFGAFASDGGLLELDRVVLARNPKAGLAVNSTASATVKNSIFRDNGLDSTGKAGAGVAVSEGANVTIDASAVIANHSSSVEAYDASTKVTITRSVLRDVLADKFGNHGDGVAIDNTAHADVSDSTIAGSAESGLLAIGVGTSASVTRTIFLGTGVEPQHGIGVSGGGTVTIDDVAVAGALDYGIVVQDKASTLTATNSLVRDVRRGPSSGTGDGVGLQIVDGGQAHLTDVAIMKCEQVAIALGGSGPTGTGSAADLTKVLVGGAHANSDGNFGRGIQGTDDSVLTATGCAVVDNQESGVVFGNGASADIRSSVIRGSGSIGDTKFGHGVVVLDSASLSLMHSAVRDNAGVGLAFEAAAARIDDVVVLHNRIGIYASGATLNDVSTTPSDLPPDQIFVSESTRFVDNATRVSSDDIPLPEVIQ